MGRRREFDSDEALTQARDLFWEKGYEATSIQDLVDKTGVQRASLYAAFGSKHGLYLATIDAYCKEQFLLDPALGLTGIKRMLRGVVEQSGQDNRGCYMVNAGVELGDCDPCVRERMSATLGAMEQGIGEALRAAQRAGEISQRPIRPLARLLVSTILGLRVMTKSHVPRPVLDDVVKTALEAIL